MPPDDATSVTGKPLSTGYLHAPNAREGAQAHLGKDGGKTNVTTPHAPPASPPASPAPTPASYAAVLGGGATGQNEQPLQMCFSGMTAVARPMAECVDYGIFIGMEEGVEPLDDPHLPRDDTTRYLLVTRSYTGDGLAHTMSRLQQIGNLWLGSNYILLAAEWTAE